MEDKSPDSNIQQRGDRNMYMSTRSLIESVAQEWYVLCAYFATFVLLEIRKYGEKVAMHRVVRHALWAASVVICLHAAVDCAAMIRQTGLDFLVLNRTLVTALTGSIVYLLGRMFEKAPRPAYAKIAGKP
jgi:hypothetical protein